MYICFYSEKIVLIFLQEISTRNFIQSQVIFMENGLVWWSNCHSSYKTHDELFNLIFLLKCLVIAFWHSFTFVVWIFFSTHTHFITFWGIKLQKLLRRALDVNCVYVICCFVDQCWEKIADVADDRPGLSGHDLLRPTRNANLSVHNHFISFSN